MPKIDLPNQAGAPSTGNLTSENIKREELYNNRIRSISGQVSWYSDSSAQTYNTIDYPSDATVYNKGEDGLLNIFQKYILKDSLWLANDANTTNNNISLLKTSPTVGGTANVITLTTPTTTNYDYSINGNPITFFPTANNTGAVTVSIDGGATNAIVKTDGIGGTIALDADDLLINVPTTIYRRTGSSNFFLAPRGGSNIKSIQRGSTTATSQATFTQSITAIDLTKSIVRITSIYSSTGTNINLALVSVKLNTSTELLFETSTSSATNIVYWEVVEFNNVKSFQKGTYLGAVANIQPISITTVDTSKSMLVVVYIATSSISSINYNQWMLGFQLSSNQITINKSNATSLNFKVEWQVIEFN